MEKFSDYSYDGVYAIPESQRRLAKRLRKWLIAFVILFAVAIGLTWFFGYESSVRFDEAQKKDPGLMGDCTGMSAIIPIAVVAYSLIGLFFSIGALTGLKPRNADRFTIFVILIGIMILLPVYFYVFMNFIGFLRGAY